MLLNSLRTIAPEQDTFTSVVIAAWTDNQKRVENGVLALCESSSQSFLTITLLTSLGFTVSLDHQNTH